ncbi:hypothetical protein [Mycobacterium sp. M26]|uniref:hypothetical protein n=1 Tax=Mycobacterium sp. M26 TaxID=1762962 RepID=UPI00073E77E4|nr:hypothetical protein [Mycobacterium sp. M26]
MEQLRRYGASGVVAVTGGVATSGALVGSSVADDVVSPVVISEVTGEVNVPGSDTMVPPGSSATAVVNAPMATMALPPMTADKALTRECGVGFFGFILVG